MANDINPHVIIGKGSRLGSYVHNTLRAYASMSQRLHVAAAMLLYWAQEHRDDCEHLNSFYKGLRVNDATALRVWFAKHAVNGEGNVWIAYSKDKGFHIRKGVPSGNLSLDDCLALDPFWNKDVAKDKDVPTLEQFLKMLATTASRITKQSEDTGIELPDFLKAELQRMEETAKQSVANGNAGNHSNIEANG